VDFARLRARRLWPRVLHATVPDPVSRASRFASCRPTPMRG
jgi:hypothetical protein